MKNYILLSILLLLIIPVFSQKQEFEYPGRMTPAIYSEEIASANYLTEIMPDFCRTFSLPFSEQKIYRRLNLAYYSQGYTIEKQENYSQLIEFVSVEISAGSKGKLYSATSTGEKLSEEQKGILRKADLGSNIRINIKFKSKDPMNDMKDKTEKITEGQYTVTVIPATEARLAGGWKQFSQYMRTSLFRKNSDKGYSGQISKAQVQFTINEEGQIINAKLNRSSGNPETDKLILEAINQMPRWEPAKNFMGLKVKQQMEIVFGGGC